MSNVVFLGGTCGVNEWRKDEAIPFLTELGVPQSAIFDPVVDDWDAAAQANEDRVKREAAVLLFYVASPGTGASDVSAYSLVEAVMSLYDEPGRAIVVFNTAGMSPHVTKALDKSERDLRGRFGDALVFGNLRQALREVAARLEEAIQ